MVIKDEFRSVTDLVWVVTGFLGDIILSTAAFDLAAAWVPHLRQTVVTTPLGAQALTGAGMIRRVITFDKRGQGAWTALRETLAAVRSNLAPDAHPLVLQVHRSLRSSLLTRSSGWPTVTYEESHGALHARWRVPRVATLHEAARIGLLLEPLGVPREAIVAARPRLERLPLDPTVAWQDRLARDREGGRRWIGVAPGSVWGTKRWTVEGFIQLSRLILDQTSYGVLLLGSKAEASLAGEIAGALGKDDSRVIDLSGQTTLDDLRRLFPTLSALVGNDSSPLHYASAFDVPTVGIFGATVPAMGFGPLASRSQVVGLELDCRPCSDHGPEVCPLGHFRCMRELEATRVFSALLGVLGEDEVR